jgi:hypothetical protein
MKCADLVSLSTIIISSLYSTILHPTLLKIKPLKQTLLPSKTNKHQGQIKEERQDVRLVQILDAFKEKLRFPSSENLTK